MIIMESVKAAADEAFTQGCKGDFTPEQLAEIIQGVVNQELETAINALQRTSDIFEQKSNDGMDAAEYPDACNEIWRAIYAARAVLVAHGRRVEE